MQERPTMKYRKFEAEYNGLKFRIEESTPEVGAYFFVLKTIYVREIIYKIISLFVKKWPLSDKEKRKTHISYIITEIKSRGLE
jgi:hypothetical protein